MFAPELDARGASDPEGEEGPCISIPFRYVTRRPARCASSRWNLPTMSTPRSWRCASSSSRPGGERQRPCRRRLRPPTFPTPDPGRRAALSVSRPRWIRQHSSGGVVIRERDGKRELLVIRPAGTDRWQLPKGRVDPGETAREAALREVREEGGVVAEAIAPLDSISYFFRGGGHGYRK